MLVRAPESDDDDQQRARSGADRGEVPQVADGAVYLHVQGGAAVGAVAWKRDQYDCIQCCQKFEVKRNQMGFKKEPKGTKSENSTKISKIALNF